MERVLAAALLVALLLSSLAIAGSSDTSSALRAAYQQPPERWPAPWIDAEVDYVELGALALPVAGTKAELGRRLFHDGRLAADGAPACTGCHHPQHGWSIPAAVARGHGGGSAGAIRRRYTPQPGKPGSAGTAQAPAWRPRRSCR